MFLCFRLHWKDNAFVLFFYLMAAAYMELFNIIKIV